MKKIAILIIVLVISSFEIDVNFKNSLRAQNIFPNLNVEENNKVESSIIRKNGITYRIFIYKNDIEVINETKEKLEIQLIEEKLKN